MNIVIFDSLEKNNEIGLDSTIGSHIVKVLGLKEGDSFKAGVWGVGRGMCKIVGIGSGVLRFVYEQMYPVREKLPLVMIVSQIRPICMRRVLRFAGECGIDSLVLARTELGEDSYSKASLYTSGEWNDLLRQGTEFSADCAKPSVYFADNVTSAIDCAENIGVKHRFVLDICDGSSKLVKPDGCGKTVLAIGGERGFTKAERELFLRSGYIAMNLGSRILRAEESAIVSVFPWL